MHGKLWVVGAAGFVAGQLEAGALGVYGDAWSCFGVEGQAMSNGWEFQGEDTDTVCQTLGEDGQQLCTPFVSAVFVAVWPNTGCGLEPRMLAAPA